MSSTSRVVAMSGSGVTNHSVACLFRDPDFMLYDGAVYTMNVFRWVMFWFCVSHIHYLLVIVLDHAVILVNLVKAIGDIIAPDASYVIV